MPHVKIADAPGPAELFPLLPLVDERDETGTRKISAYYLDREGEQILAEALVAAEGLPQRFFISLKGRGGEIMVRLLPATDPEKTAAVKRLVARLGLIVLGLCEGASLKTTNLEPELKALGGG